jgi:hypothetical protein
MQYHSRSEAAKANVFAEMLDSARASPADCDASTLTADAGHRLSTLLGPVQAFKTMPKPVMLERLIGRLDRTGPYLLTGERN